MLQKLNCLYKKISVSHEHFFLLVLLSFFIYNLLQIRRFPCYFPSPAFVTIVAQLVKKLPAVQETWVWSLSWEDPLEKGKATHSSILAWRIPWTIQSMGLQRIGHNWVTITFTFMYKKNFSRSYFKWIFFTASRTIDYLPVYRDDFIWNPIQHDCLTG